MTEFRALELAFAEAKKWLGGLEDRPVEATADFDELRSKIKLELNSQGIPAEQVIEHLVSASQGGHVGSAGGRFFAWVISGGLPSALAADWLTSSWDQNAAIYAAGPAASVIEEVAGQWIVELLDLPRESSFAFTTGCQLAHFTCLASARTSVLKNIGWNINENGLSGAPPIRVLTSEHRHCTVDRAVRFLGLGSKCLISIEADALGRVIPSKLEKALSQSKQPTILVLDAADLNVAAFDPFEVLIPMAKSSQAWVHIDGAFGLFARTSHEKRHLTQGLELADSWATDAHKWLNVPFDCGIAIVRDREIHREAMTMSASYIAAETKGRDQIDWTPEWSRRARGIPVYAALRELGKQGVADLVNRTSKHCHTIVTEIGKLPGAQMLWEPILNQGLVRFLDTRSAATEADHDLMTEKIIEKINATGEAFFAPTTWNGKRAMRVSVVNWRTTHEDVRRTIEAVKRVLLASIL